VTYIRKHPEVAAGQRSIDVGTLLIYYCGRNCQPFSAENHLSTPLAWEGLADPLELKHSGCSDD
jgi:hypothetical protein